MKTIEGKVVTIYNDNDNDNSWIYNLMIVDSEILTDGGLNIIVKPIEMPLDFEKKFKSIQVLVEVDDNGKVCFDENGIAKIHKKTQNIREILSLFGPSKEMKQRLNNGQIKINNEVIKSFDVEVNIEFNWETHKLVDLPDFLMDSDLDLKQVALLKSYANLDIFNFFGSPTIFEEKTNINKFAFLSKFILISISKREHYVFVNADVESEYLTQ